jgi:hypothetical protein
MSRALFCPHLFQFVENRKLALLTKEHSWTVPCHHLRVIHADLCFRSFSRTPFYTNITTCHVEFRYLYQNVVSNNTILNELLQWNSRILEELVLEKCNWYDHRLSSVLIKELAFPSLRKFVLIHDPLGAFPMSAMEYLTSCLFQRSPLMRHLTLETYGSTRIPSMWFSAFPVQLQTLILRGIDLRYVKLSEILDHCYLLRECRFIQCELNTHSLPTTKRECPLLRVLDMSFNYLHDTTSPSYYFPGCHLSTLMVCGNFFENWFHRHIFQWESLETLNVEMNNITNEGCRLLSEHGRFLVQLQTFKLSSNSFDKKGMEYLYKFLSELYLTQCLIRNTRLKVHIDTRSTQEFILLRHHIHETYLRTILF